MKRGLKLALMALAMMALAVPVFARAPVVKPLPIVIIGDEDAGDNDGTLYLMRYNDIVNLKKYVDFNNPTYTSDTFHLYMLPLADAESSPRASTDLALVDNMTNTAYVDLRDSATLPAGTMDMTYWNSAADEFFSLSLIDDYINQMAATPMTDSVNAVLATHGVDRAATYGANFAARTDVLFVAAVSSGTSKAVIDTQNGVDTTIWTVAGTTDSTTGTGLRKVFTSPPPVDTWYNGTYDYLRPLTVQAQTTTSGQGVGYYVSGADSTYLTFGTWTLLLSDFSGYVIPHDGGGGLTSPVLEFLATLQSDAASPDLCPAWRFFITNSAFSHTVVSETNTPSGHLAAPYAGSPYIARAYVATPYQLSEMGDGEVVSRADYLFAGHPDEDNDGRNYSFSFDLVHPAGATQDRATFLLTALDVYAFEAPAHETVLSADQGSGAYADWFFENWEVQGGGPGEFWQGAFAVAPDHSWFELYVTDSRPYTRRMKKATSGWEDAYRTPFNGNTLVRKSTTLGVTDINTAPLIQLLTFVFSSAGDQRGAIYADLFGDITLSRGKPIPKVAGEDAAGVPHTIGSDDVVHAYHWMPTKVDSGDKMIFQTQAYTEDMTTNNDFKTTWGDTLARVRQSDMVVEEVAIPELVE